MVNEAVSKTVALWRVGSNPSIRTTKQKEVLCMATLTKYDSFKFEVVPSRYGATVYYDGEFFESADSTSEAYSDIEKFIEGLEGDE